MNTIKRMLVLCLSLLLLPLMAQQEEEPRKPGHQNINRFRQLYDEMATPNGFRTASGKPGPDYYQQQADYVMDIELDDNNARIYGEETITYHNNAPEALEFLWVQLDQNVRAKDSKADLRNPSNLSSAYQPGSFARRELKEAFDGGFNIEYVRDANGNELPHMINWTMMRVDLPQPLASGEQFSFKIKWWYNIQDRMQYGGRSGLEYFPEDGNNLYTIAQFFPRMAVYNDVEGWQNHQFWGSGEFALPFGNYEVNLTVPADHIVDATGELLNRKQVFTRTMMKRYEEAKKSYDKPVLIVTQEEAEAAEKSRSDKKKTWKFRAENVRDFAFASSRKFIWDMQAVKLGGKDVMAVSLYPKEGNPLWEEYSTKTVVATLEGFSKYTFDYPYHKAISVHTANIGMEYPMICFNFGRPDKDGNYSDRTKFGMISVIIHEVGHNFFPMIVNSDERQWGWMDEGLNTYTQYLTEQYFGEKHPEAIAPNEKYPSQRGPATGIVRYMSADQDYLAPIMSNPENVYSLGPNAYGKPATALNILRETVVGKELFDDAFRTYARRWMFKHPTPEDFFRTIEEVTAIDLDYYWRGWFYTTEYVDMGVKEVKKFRLSAEPSEELKERLAERNITEYPDYVYMVEDTVKVGSDNPRASEAVPALKEYLDGLSAEERAKYKDPKNLYQITFEKPGGIPMPLIVEYTYSDGTVERVTYPAEIWRKNDAEVSRVIATDKELVSVVVDPKLETADIDLSNNNWPSEEEQNEFDQFKSGVKG